ncbi:MAG: tetratricopeptide repeat protein [Candidatus Obscuribacterales bacterium]|nr:tetratricopeptide repeat protein [Candidatus Obscuribacterales bacterium]
MEFRINLSSLATVVSAMTLIVCNATPTSAQALRQPEHMGQNILSGEGSFTSPGAASGSSYSSQGSRPNPTATTIYRPLHNSPTMQVKTYKTRKAPLVFNPSAIAKDARKIIADAVKYYNEGVNDEKKGDLNNAAMKLKHSVTIREYYWKHRDRQLPTVLDKLAEVYEKQNKLSEAADTLEKSLAYYTKIYGPGTPERISTLLQLGNILEKRTDEEKSFDNFKQAYMLMERADGKHDAEVGKLRLKLARQATKNGWLQSAAEFYSESCNPEHTPLAAADHAGVLEEYSGVLMKLGKEEEARETMARAHQHKRETLTSELSH